MRALAEILAVLAPPACVACRAPLRSVDALLCAPCLRGLPWLRGHRCPRCGLPSHRARVCPAAGAAFTRAWAPLAYEGVARDVVAALKFRGALPVADLMAAQMAANLPADLLAARAAVVPVPAQPRRRRARGFDPAGALAAAFARRAGLAHADCLRRTDRGPRQVGAPRAARRRSGRIAVTACASAPQRVLLIDDVHTTGATLQACAQALAAAGARQIAALSYARAL